MNLRGTLLTVVDLSVRLGGRSETPPVVVVVEAGGRRFGIGVESVEGVADAAADAIEAVNAQRSSGGVVAGVVHLGGEPGVTAQWCEVEAIAREALAV